MGINSTTKGKSGERELIRVLSSLLGDAYNLSRNLNQSRDGGATGDIVGIAGWAVECKRASRYSNSWWKQAQRQAVNGDRPVLAYRLDRQTWRCEVLGADVLPALRGTGHRITMDVECWTDMVAGDK